MASTACRPNAHFLGAARANVALAVALVSALALGAANSARGDVIGIGDITPSQPDPFPETPGDEIPDLPQFGGPVSGGALIVGGTGQLVGGTSAGQMTIDIPSDTAPLTSTTGVIGGDAFGFGLVRIVSLNSEWKVADTLQVGNEGQGYLELIAGARLSTGDGGQAGAGGLDFQMGAVSGSQGLAVVDGFASLLLTASASIGKQGIGRIEIINRGRFESVQDAVVGEEFDVLNSVVGSGSVLVEGAGSRWNIGVISTSVPNAGLGNLTVGSAGRGTIEIQDQGIVRTKGDSVLGSLAASFGEVMVRGQNSQFWTVNNLRVGVLGTGRLELVDRGLARADAATTVGTSGIIEFFGGTLLTPLVANSGVIRGDGRITSPLVVNDGDIRTAAGVANLRERLWITGDLTNNNFIDSIGGEMEVEGLVTNNAGAQIYGRDAIFRFRGGLVGSGELVLENSLVESPVATVANLVVDPDGSSGFLGDLNLGGGGTELSIGPNVEPLLVTGIANLAGSLDIFLDTNYSPRAGDSFTLIQGGSVAGTFAPVSFPSTSGILWDIDYNPDSVVLNVLAGAAPGGNGADFDNSGLVDGADLTILRQNFGLTPALQSDGDANGDGIVDGADMLLWQLQLGTSPVVVAAANVPEPSALVLALAAMGLPLLRKKRR